MSESGFHHRIDRHTQRLRHEVDAEFTLECTLENHTHVVERNNNHAHIFTDRDEIPATPTRIRRTTRQFDLGRIYALDDYLQEQLRRAVANKPPVTTIVHVDEPLSQPTPIIEVLATVPTSPEHGRYALRQRTAIAMHPYTMLSWVQPETVRDRRVDTSVLKEIIPELNEMRKRTYMDAYEPEDYPSFDPDDVLPDEPVRRPRVFKGSHMEEIARRLASERLPEVRKRRHLRIDSSDSEPEQTMDHIEDLFKLDHRPPTVEPEPVIRKKRRKLPERVTATTLMGILPASYTRVHALEGGVRSSDEPAEKPFWMRSPSPVAEDDRDMPDILSEPDVFTGSQGAKTVTRSAPHASHPLQEGDRIHRMVVRNDQERKQRRRPRTHATSKQKRQENEFGFIQAYEAQYPSPRSVKAPPDFMRVAYRELTQREQQGTLRRDNPHRKVVSIQKRHREVDDNAHQRTLQRWKQYHPPTNRPHRAPAVETDYVQETSIVRKKTCQNVQSVDAVFIRYLPDDIHFDYATYIGRGMLHQLLTTPFRVHTVQAIVTEPILLHHREQEYELTGSCDSLLPLLADMTTYVDELTDVETIQRIGEAVSTHLYEQLWNMTSDEEIRLFSALKLLSTRVLFAASVHPLLHLYVVDWMVRLACYSIEHYERPSTEFGLHDLVDGLMTRLVRTQHIPHVHHPIIQSHEATCWLFVYHVCTSERTKWMFPSNFWTTLTNVVQGTHVPYPYLWELVDFFLPFLQLNLHGRKDTACWLDASVGFFDAAIVKSIRASKRALSHSDARTILCRLHAMLALPKLMFQLDFIQVFYRLALLTPCFHREPIHVPKVLVECTVDFSQQLDPSDSCLLIYVKVLVRYYQTVYVESWDDVAPLQQQSWAVMEIEGPRAIVHVRTIELLTMVHARSQLTEHTVMSLYDGVMRAQPDESWMQRLSLEFYIALMTIHAQRSLPSTEAIVRTFTILGTVCKRLIGLQHALDKPFVASMFKQQATEGNRQELQMRHREQVLLIEWTLATLQFVWRRLARLPANLPTLIGTFWTTAMDTTAPIPLPVRTAALYLMRDMPEALDITLHSIAHPTTYTAAQVIVSAESQGDSWDMRLDEQGYAELERAEQTAYIQAMLEAIRTNILTPLQTLVLSKFRTGPIM